MKFFILLKKKKRKKRFSYKNNSKKIFCVKSHHRKKYKKKLTRFSFFQDINFIYRSRISRINKTINNRECNSRMCRFRSIIDPSALLRSLSLLNRLNSDVNNNEPDKEPLISHDNRRMCKCKCSCLPRLFFNCCFVVSLPYFINCLKNIYLYIISSI